MDKPFFYLIPCPSPPHVNCTSRDIFQLRKSVKGQRGIREDEGIGGEGEIVFFCKSYKRHGIADLSNFSLLKDKRERLLSLAIDKEETLI